MQTEALKEQQLEGSVRVLGVAVPDGICSV